MTPCFETFNLIYIQRFIDNRKVFLKRYILKENPKHLKWFLWNFQKAQLKWVVLTQICKPQSMDEWDKCIQVNISEIILCFLEMSCRWDNMLMTCDSVMKHQGTFSAVILFKKWVFCESFSRHQCMFWLWLK